MKKLYYKQKCKVVIVIGFVGFVGFFLCSLEKETGKSVGIKLGNDGQDVTLINKPCNPISSI